MPQPAAMPERELVSRLMATLEERWVMSLATVAPGEGHAHTAPLFYAHTTLGDPPMMVLVFASSPETQHSRHVAVTPEAAASVYLETEEVGVLRGVQMRGRVVDTVDATEAAARACRDAYLSRHPVAAPILESGRHHLYAFVPTWAKLTDNRLGMGVHPQLSLTPDLAAVGLTRA